MPVNAPWPFDLLAEGDNVATHWSPHTTHLSLHQASIAPAFDLFLTESNIGVGHAGQVFFDHAFDLG